MSFKRNVSVLLCYLSFGVQFTQATPISIDPDNYTIGTDLSYVSDYVSIRSVWAELDDTGFIQAEGSVFATPASGPAPAPTGELSFGLYGFLTAMATPTDVLQGLAFRFSQPVNSISLLAQVNHPDWNLPLAASWQAFDQFGNVISTGFTEQLVGQPTLISIQLPEIWSFVIGGDTGISVVEFDALSFNTIDVAEPNSIMLLLLGLMPLLVLRQKYLV